MCVCMEAEGNWDGIWFVVNMGVRVKYSHFFWVFTTIQSFEINYECSTQKNVEFTHHPYSSGAVYP